MVCSYRIFSIGQSKSPRVVLTNFKKVYIISEDTQGEKNSGHLFLITFLRSCSHFRANVCTTTERFLKLVNTTRGDFDWLIETMRYCRFDLRGPRIQQKFLLSNCVRVPRESSFGEVTKPISMVFVSWWICTWLSFNVLLFHRGNKLPPGFARRDAIAWLES